MSYAKARWLEPIGQVIAFLAFSIQFFYVDPASYGALRASLDALRLESVEGKDSAPAGTEQEFKAQVERRVAQLNAEHSLLSDDNQRQRWRKGLFVTFMIGALFTIIGKAASVKYSTK